MGEMEWELPCEDGDDLLAEHYEWIAWQPKCYDWAGGEGYVDLRKVNMNYALNIMGWMEKHHSDNTPYKSLKQYRYLNRKYKAWIDLAKEVLKGPKYSWQALRTYASTKECSASSKETQGQASPSRRARTRRRTSLTWTAE